MADDDNSTDNKPEKKVIKKTVRIPIELSADVAKRAADDGMTENDLMRRAIERYLDPGNDPITKADLVSFFEQIQTSIERVRPALEAPPATADDIAALKAAVEEVSKARTPWYKRLFGSGDE